MPYLDAGGVKLYFEEHGEGYPIIFVHELVSDLRQWEDQMRHFSRSYRCIAYNARGYPPSDVPEDPAAYGWDRVIDDLANVMRSLAIDCAHVIGLSMGAYTALQFALQHPQNVSAVVAAAAGSGSLPAHRSAWLREMAVLARAFDERSAATMAYQIAKSETRIQLKYKDPKRWRDFTEQLRQQSGRGLSNTMARCQALRPPLHDLRDQLLRMTVPVLLAVGDEDLPCLETNLMLKATLPNAGLWISPNTGHAVNLEEPAAFNAEVETFLNAVERGIWRRGYSTINHGSKPAIAVQSFRTKSFFDSVKEKTDPNVIPLRQANRPTEMPPAEPPP